MVKQRKLKKLYEGGGPFPYAQAGEIAGSLFDAVTPTNSYGVKSNGAAIGGSALKGAGTGAAMGTMIMPGIGTAIGAGVGAIAGGVSGLVNNNKNKRLQADAYALNDKRTVSRSLARMSNYDTLGSNVNDIYAEMGGQLPQTQVPGGNLKQLSGESAQIEGQSHSNGGVQLGNGVEVEGGETLKQNFVFSKALGFADLHKPIAKAIGKMEKKPLSTVTNSTIKLLKSKEEALKMQQESLKEQLGIKPLETAAMGGFMNVGVTKRIYA